MMTFANGVLLGFFVGGILGTLIMAAMNLASDADDAEEHRLQEADDEHPLAPDHPERATRHDGYGHDQKHHRW